MTSHPRNSTLGKYPLSPAITSILLLVTNLFSATSLMGTLCVSKQPRRTLVGKPDADYRCHLTLIQVTRKKCWGDDDE